jgi:hypothetical protein
MVFKRKPNNEGIIDDSDDKKAIPELEFKRSIFNSILLLGDLENNLMLNFERLGNYKRLDVILFERELIKLFDLLKNMIIESKKMDEEDKKSYFLIKKIKYRLIKPNISQLLLVKDFLLEYAHELNITNLLMGGGQNFIDATKSEYG